MTDLSWFDPSSVPESQDLVPPGQYVAQIMATERHDGPNGQWYLSIEWQIIEGPLRGRRLWSRLYLQHHNQAAVDIAQQNLAAICRAVGVERPHDSSELHGRTLVITIRHRTDRDGVVRADVRGFARHSPNGRQTTPPWL